MQYTNIANVRKTLSPYRWRGKPLKNLERRTGSFHAIFTKTKTIGFPECKKKQFFWTIR